MAIILICILVTALVISCIAENRRRGSDTIVLCLWKYLSFYTIQSNVLVLIWISSQVFFPATQIGSFAAEANVSAAVTFYIFTVGLANYLLYGWQALSPLDRLSDLLVHAVTPLFTLLFWVVYADKSELSFSYLGYWLIYPLTYALYTVLHGNWSRFYPYEFANVQSLGLRQVAMNAFGLTLSLILGGSLFIVVGKSLA